MSGGAVSAPAITKVPKERELVLPLVAKDVDMRRGSVGVAVAWQRGQHRRLGFGGMCEWGCAAVEVATSA